MARMPAWVILPVVLPVFSITGMCIVYAMALSNNHICSVTNWVYNQSCELEGPTSCCTLDHVPLVRRFFSPLMKNLGSSKRGPVSGRKITVDIGLDDFPTVGI